MAAVLYYSLLLGSQFRYAGRLIGVGRSPPSSNSAISPPVDILYMPFAFFAKTDTAFRTWANIQKTQPLLEKLWRKYRKRA